MKGRPSMRGGRARIWCRYMPPMTTFLCLLSLLLLSGCPYESHVPLGTSAHAKIDERLLGRWKYEDKESKETGFLTISRFNDSEMLISAEGEAGKAPDMMRAFVTTIDGENFLNIQEMKYAYPDRKWIFVSYKTGDCSLTYRVVNDSIGKAELTSRQLFELVKKNLGSNDIFDEPTTLTCLRK